MGTFHHHKKQLEQLRWMNILEKDQEFILELFMKSVIEVNKDPDMTLMLTLSKFGQKDEEVIDLKTLVNPVDHSTETASARLVYSCFITFPATILKFPSKLPSKLIKQTLRNVLDV